MLGTFLRLATREAAVSLPVQVDCHVFAITGQISQRLDLCPMLCES
jgi:hypothetical protein